MNNSRSDRVNVGQRARRGEAKTWIENHLTNPPDTDACVLYPYARSSGAVYRGTTVGRIILGLAPGDKLVVRHTCHTPTCVNRRHLTPGTAAQNSQDMIDAGRSLTGAQNPNYGLAIKKNRNPARLNAAIQVRVTA